MKEKDIETQEETKNQDMETSAEKTEETAAENGEATTETAEETPEKTDTEKLAEAEEEIEKLHDRLLRQMAEFDNYRKRSLKEKAELILNGGSKVIESLLPVLDDLERAQENMQKATDVDTLREGVDLIISKLEKTLSGHGLKKMDTREAVFDTDYHEAIALTPAQDESQKNHIIDCVQAGYMLNEKVLRHAKVVVGQ